MKIRRESEIRRQKPKYFRAHGADLNRHSAFHFQQAFTLIEIMVVVGILAIIMSIAIPSVYQQMKKDGMRLAVSDVLEACGQARARAILDGSVCTVTIRVPPNGGINVASAGRPSGGSGFLAAGAGEMPLSGGGGGIFSARFSNHIIKVDATVFEAADHQAENEVVCKFYANGTCDAMRVELVSDQNEVRVITTDVVTGIADVEVVR